MFNFFSHALSGISVLVLGNPSLARNSASPLFTDFNSKINVVEQINPDTGASTQFADFVGLANVNSASQSAVIKNLTSGLGNLDIQYQSGDSSQRLADIVKSPGDLSGRNKALRFILKQPNIFATKEQASRGRVQANIYDNEPGEVRKFYMAVDVLLGKDGFTRLNEYPKSVDWLTISDWWNNVGWGEEEFPFRISVDIVKPDRFSNSPFYFKVRASQKRKLDRRVTTEVWDDVWVETNKKIQVPVGQWFTLEYFWKEGSDQTGRFSVAITRRSDQIRHVVFDIRRTTHNPLNKKPDGLKHFNPMKLETSGEYINFVREKGHALEILWDNLDLRVCKDSLDIPCPSIGSSD